nr:hypothetical protein [Mycobacterium leprae]
MPTAVLTGALYGDELAAAYASMDILVHTDEHEMLCEIVQKALASGLSVVISDAGRPRNLVIPCCAVLLPTAVAHLVAERHSYSPASRHSVLWPVIRK